MSVWPGRFTPMHLRVCSSARRLTLLTLLTCAAARAQGGAPAAANDASTASPPKTPAPATPGADHGTFPGYGGLALGVGVSLVVPFGNAAGGDNSAMSRSHGPGFGFDFQGGVLFLRQFGVFADLGMAQHLSGSDTTHSASSFRFGLTGRYLFFPKLRTPFAELGLVRDVFASNVATLAGDADRSSSSWDARLGGGYQILTADQSLFLTPFATLDFGKFSSVDQTLEKTNTTFDIASDDRAWHYVLSVGMVAALGRRVPQLLGPIDSDGDGVLGTDDHCPSVREDRLPPLPNDGCPTTDQDNDGVANSQDRCLSVAEDHLPPQPSDGCPTDDADQDGVAGAADACPAAKEDGLKPAAADGCPTNDHDQDDVADGKDACPDAPETVNGIDDDGCPDAGRVSVNVETHQISISEKIFFQTGSAEISRRSLALIGEVAGALKHFPQAELVEVAGHADLRGEAARNLKLTQARADSVRYALIDRGVPPSQLTAVGYGPYCPVDEGKTEAAFEKNRRVEFRIVRISGKPTGVQTSCPAAEARGIHGTDPNASGAPTAPAQADATAPTEREVRAAIARADASVVFPDYHGCQQGEPYLDRVVVLAVQRAGAFWQAKADAVVRSRERFLPETCFSKPQDKTRWKALYGQTTTVTVTLSRADKSFKLVLP